jgi:hypothetical protein
MTGTIQRPEFIGGVYANNGTDGVILGVWFGTAELRISLSIEQAAELSGQLARGASGNTHVFCVNMTYHSIAG